MLRMILFLCPVNIEHCSVQFSFISLPFCLFGCCLDVERFYKMLLNRIQKNYDVKINQMLLTCVLLTGYLYFIY